MSLRNDLTQHVIIFHVSHFLAGPMTKENFAAESVSRSLFASPI